MEARQQKGMRVQTTGPGFWTPDPEMAYDLAGGVMVEPADEEQPWAANGEGGGWCGES
jgi:hypothetical protein